ncbi:ribulose-phosphate 3-epimerase [Spirosoma arcticum]
MTSTTRISNPALIAPSLLAADFANLQRDLELINRSEADYLHFDVMDGVFVPNISFGFPLLEAARKHCRKPLDVHLMITQPDRYLDAFAEGGAAVIHVHLEACPHLHRTLTRIRELGCRAGVAINPHTPIAGLEDVLEQIDVVLVMSVNPGFGGQSFIPHTIQKVAKLKQMLLANQSSALIEIDGGVSTGNASVLLSAGADILVAGNSIFKAGDPLEAIRQLKNSSQPMLA